MYKASTCRADEPKALSAFPLDEADGCSERNRRDMSRIYPWLQALIAEPPLT